MNQRIVLVGGPQGAGVTSLVAALKDRLGDLVVEAADLPRGAAPTAVVFVVSAAARLVASDCDVLDTLWVGGAVVGVVSKVDAHRRWRDTLAANRIALAGYRGQHAEVHWVGAAAAPDLGGQRIDELADLLDRILTQPMSEPNLLHDNKSRSPVSVRRAAKSVTLRGHTQQVRVRLAAVSRARCVQLRAELVDSAGRLTRRSRAGFTAQVRSRVAEVAADLDAEVTDRLAVVAAELDLPDELREVRLAPPASTEPAVDLDGLESRLTITLGAGFALGVSLTLGRVAAELAPSHSVPAAIGAVLLGAALATWLVATRRLIAERTAMQRWATESVAALRAATDEAVALRMIAAERLWSSTVFDSPDRPPPASAGPHRRRRTCAGDGS